MVYDVIIAGASFAGLAVAAELRGRRVLLLDRKPIGAAPTSACLTLVHTLRALQLEDCVQEVYDEIVVHTPRQTLLCRVPEPNCTFDYGALCQALLRRTDVEFRQCAALGLAPDGGVRTREGTFYGRLLVDATGWRAAIAASLHPGLVRPRDLTMGIETVTPFSDARAHFWYALSGTRPPVMAWAFPAGDASRVGVARYPGGAPLGPALDDLLHRLGLARGALHGGPIPNRPRPPVVGDVFLVGDAAGQALGTSGEGIRPAFLFGAALGRLLRAVLEGALTRQAAQARYQRFVAAHRWPFLLARGYQGLLERVPVPAMDAFLAASSTTGLYRAVVGRYMRGFRLAAPQAGAQPGVAGGARAA